MRRFVVLVLAAFAMLAGSCSDDSVCPVTYEPSPIRQYSLGILREVWKIASPPVNSDTDLPRPSRGFHDPALNWYNPYVQFRITDIYDRPVVHQSDDRTHVLILDHDPSKSILLDSVASNRDVWTGIMRALPNGASDQSLKEYIDVRMAVRPGPGGVSELGTLHIDLGRINEDVDGNDRLDTEDLKRNGIRNGILDDGEDVGLDGIPDEDEFRIVGTDTLRYDLITNPDPAGDNWHFVHQTPEDVTGINGTEGNSAEFLGGRPDTENLHGGYAWDLDIQNSYYSFAIDLANPGAALVEGSEKTDNHHNLTWKSYSIPLWGAFADAIIGAPSSYGGIQYVRLWMDNAESRMQVYIAAMDLVTDLRDDDTLSISPIF